VIFAITPVLLSTDNLRGAEPSAVMDAETVRQKMTGEVKMASRRDSRRHYNTQDKKE